nr:hypothetical protein HmN_000966500 [Hymenolepis microstoma]
MIKHSHLPQNGLLSLTSDRGLRYDVDRLHGVKHKVERSRLRDSQKCATPSPPPPAKPRKAKNPQTFEVTTSVRLHGFLYVQQHRRRDGIACPEEKNKKRV